MSTSDLQKNGISFVLDCLLYDCLVDVLGNKVDHNSVENSALVLDPAAFHHHKKSSHGSSRLVCSGLESCCLA